MSQKNDDGVDVGKLLPSNTSEAVVDVTEVLGNRVGEWTTPGWISHHVEISDSYNYKVLKALNEAGVIHRRETVSGEVEYRLPTKEQRIEKSFSHLLRELSNDE